MKHKNKLIASTALLALPLASPAHATTWQMWGHEACTVKYALQGTIYIVVNGCSPIAPGLNGKEGSAAGTKFIMEGPYAVWADCEREAKAVTAEMPPYTNGTCIEFN